jgi:hypothetical protein
MQGRRSEHATKLRFPGLVEPASLSPSATINARYAGILSRRFIVPTYLPRFLVILRKPEFLDTA